MVMSNQTPDGLKEPSHRSEQRSQADNTQFGKMQEKRMMPFQKERLFKKLDGWEEAARHKAQIISQYKELLQKSGYTVQKLDHPLKPVFYKFPLLSPHKREIFEYAKRNGIEMSDMFGSPLYPPERRANWRALGYREGMCPTSENISDKIIALPVHSKIKSKEIEKITTLLAAFL
jgi:dTDP-4-amino-4,6-dideoxygalactose transaminase